MFSNQSAEHHINVPARCVRAISGDSTSHRFLVGSCFLPRGEGSREEYEYHDDADEGGGGGNKNEIHSLRFLEDMNEVCSDAVYSHPTGEVWKMSPCPTDESLLVTCGGGGEGSGGSGRHETVLWRLPPPRDDMPDDTYNEDAEDGAGPTLPMDKITTLPVDEDHTIKSLVPPDRVVEALWSPQQQHHLVTLTPSTLQCWDVDVGAATSDETAGAHVVTKNNPSATASAAAWDPHNPHLLAIACGTDLATWDIRTMKRAHVIRDAHRYAVTDVDCNPNRPHLLTSGGQDGLVKFWDVRNTTTLNAGPAVTQQQHSKQRQRPIKILAGHTHWVSTVKYNPFHDQLVLSGGTDTVANLWRISSISSAPLLELDHDGTGSADVPDVRVSKMEHPDAVYEVAWSACDAWVYATLSYDGQVVLNHVPSKEKYKILL